MCVKYMFAAFYSAIKVSITCVRKAVLLPRPFTKAHPCSFHLSKTSTALECRNIPGLLKEGEILLLAIMGILRLYTDFSQIIALSFLSTFFLMRAKRSQERSSSPFHHLFLCCHRSKFKFDNLNNGEEQLPFFIPPLIPLWKKMKKRNRREGKIFGVYRIAIESC